ncbi:predicted protein [Streptomyces viridosporus ATCC 14672]|uniref:Predicted protein n=1 Tax=Streptomyces viridosporus (strain ATCC 14672 / DSM 40746 / JCM 4963 / KCTC 9882 / NRRL B-12104 / FH 1290) TaxID=566461 RepID=D6A0R1_STRV1|nr:predicted protein [Streptomyces viridosporus ATCC 14672]
MRRHPELGGPGRVVVPPGARRCRRHESSPHTRRRRVFRRFLPSARSPSTSTDVISGRPPPPRRPHLIDMARRSSGCTVPPSAPPLGRSPSPRTGATGSLPPTSRTFAAK